MKPKYVGLVVASILIIVAIILILNYRSKHPGSKRIIELVNSDGACDRIKGFIAIGYSKDTSLYNLFFVNVKDQHIAHCLKYYGKSVVWGKIEALRRITGIDPPKNYNPIHPDLKILDNYREIIEMKFLTKKDSVAQENH
jgi:hypothetical protein